MSGEAALAFLLQTVKEVLTDYTNLRAGARGQFEQLEDELGLLEVFLKNSANKSEKSDLYREKERQIRELVYDMEDTIETCLTKKAAAKNNSFSGFFQKFRTGMAKRVKSLREERVRPILDVINQEFGKGDRDTTSLEKPRTQLKMDQSMVQPSVTVIQDQSTGQQRGTTTQYQSSKQDKVVAFEDEETIIGYLKESKDKLDVISITGMPGLGKTTFARKIFEHDRIVSEFPLRIWIRVSQNFNSRDAFLKILEKFTVNGTSSPQDEELIPTIRACLEKETFLLVMDDVWTVEDWEVIKEILPEENGKGKVLITTREREVATKVNLCRNPHQLSVLGPKESLELLRLKAFENLEDLSPELESIVQKIAYKCGRVPLIILVIGGILKDVFMETKSPPALIEEWSKVLGNVPKLLKEDKKKLISDALELSYNRLAYDMRVCFLYTGLFPKNYEIPASTLTKLWIAEGFIRRKDGQSIEETAKKTLDALINMNLLMVAKKNLDQVKACQVHDMIREFCKAKAMEEKIFRVIKESNEGVIEPPVSEVQKFRRLCLHSDLSKFLSAKPNGPRVRSFLCFFEKETEKPFKLDSVHISTISEAFNLLRVFNCKSIKFGQFPEVSKLILLKHITLSIDNTDVLPKQISQLVNLRTLIVDTKLDFITVKANIWKMIQLRCLKTKAAIFVDGKKWKGEACENLQTVSRLSPKCCEAALSERAPNLKILGIRGKLANLFDTFSLEKFILLEKLKLVNEPKSNNPLVLTQPNCFPPNLKSLTLSITCLKWNDHMPILANIKALKILKLKDNAFADIHWEYVGGGFKKLQFLLIENTTLVSWKASEAHFHCVRWLVLKNCEKLQEIPMSLAKNLERLEIEKVKESVADSARKIKSIRKQVEQNQQSIFQVPFKLTIGSILSSV